MFLGSYRLAGRSRIGSSRVRPDAADNRAHSTLENRAWRLPGLEARTNAFFDLNQFTYARISGRPGLARLNRLNHKEIQTDFNGDCKSSERQSAPHSIIHSPGRVDYAKSLVIRSLLRVTDPRSAAISTLSGS